LERKQIHFIINPLKRRGYFVYAATRLNIKKKLMEYITLCLDSTNEVEQWYVRHSYFYYLII